MRNKLTVILIAALLVSGMLCLLGCDNSEDPAMEMLRQTQGSAPTPPPAPAPEPEAAPVTPPAAPAEVPAVEGEEPAAEGEEVPAVEGEDPAAEGEEPAVEGEETPAVEGEEPAAEGEEVPEVEGEEPAAEGEEVAAEGEVVPAEGEEAPVVEDEGLTLEGEEVPAIEEEGFIEDEEAPVSDDPIENFKAMDPRDIIIAKYDDMAGRKTEPWNEEDPEGFIPETGRPDPMTRVFDSVPDELKPPRAGQTDQNDINSYLVASEATGIVENISLMLVCDNVIQVGLEKYATFGIGGRAFTLSEGQNTGQTVGSSTGIPIQISITVTSITSDQVSVAISASGVGTNVSVGKNVMYIPANQF